MKIDLPKFSTSPEAFRNELLIDVDGSVKELAKVLDPWQREDFAKLDPALLRCAGRSDSPAIMRAFLERPRGHSKTTDLAVLVVWALAFASRPLRGYAFAADKDQAALLKDAIDKILRLNPWLAQVLEVQRDQVHNTAQGHPGRGAKLEISASDVGSSYGILPDLIIADELCHWQGDGSLWHSLLSSAGKRESCLMVIISNAGFADSWQWQVREAARVDADWIFSRLDGPVASWMTPKRLEEQRRMLPPMAFARLWLNEWSSGGGDALTPEDIARAFRDDLAPMTGKEQDFDFVAGLDLALSRDAAALVALGCGKTGTPQQGKIRLADVKLWHPKPGERIDHSDVERTILQWDEKFDLVQVAFDSWNMASISQRLEWLAGNRKTTRRGFLRKTPVDRAWLREVASTGSNLREMAGLLIESFADGRLWLYESGNRLRQDLLKARVEERTYGIRITSPRDSTGHGDTLSAFMLALLAGHYRQRLGTTYLEFTGANTPTKLDRLWSDFAEKQREYDDAQREMNSTYNHPYN